MNAPPSLAGRALDRRIIGLAIPALGSLAVEPLYILADTAIVGRIGTSELAGLAIAAAILSIVFAGANFLTYGTTERVARRVGASDPAGAANIGVQALWLGALIGVVAAVIVGAGAQWWVSLLGASDDAAPHAVTYLSISAVGIPAILVTLAAQGVLRGHSDYVRPMWVLAGANFANLVIESVWVFGLGGAVGASAWSTVISQYGAAAVFLVLLRSRLAPATQRHPRWSEMRPLMSAGGYLLVRVGSMLVVLTTATSLAARSGSVVVAAHSIVMSIFTFVALVLDALAMPAQNLVAESLGRGDTVEPVRIARRVALWSVVAGAIIGAAVIAGRGAIPALFTADGAVRDAAATGLAWLGLGLVPGAVAFAYDGALIGYGRYRFLALAAAGVTVGLTPLAFLVAAHPTWGLGGIWAVLALWFTVRATLNSLAIRQAATGETSVPEDHRH